MARSTSEPRQACLLLAHELRPSLLRLHRDLCEASEQVEVHLLFHAKGALPAALAELPRVFAFRDEDLAALPFPTFRETLLPGSAHFPLLLFQRAQPAFGFYWLIEHDVRFTGRWSDLFAACRDDPSDLLACHVRERAAQPRWPWWRSLRHPREQVPLEDRLGALLPCYRLSERALRCLHESHRDGWTGHAEVLVPTLLRRAGLSVAEIGGNGPFTPPERSGRYYATDLSPDRRWLRSTVRYRPPVWWPRRPDTLYHPVKGPITTLAATGSALRTRVRRKTSRSE